MELTPQVVSSSERHPGRPTVLDEDQLHEIVKLKAQGLPDYQIAKLYSVSPQTVARHLKSPAAQEMLGYWRGIIQQALLRGIAEGAVNQGFQVLEEAAKEKNAKSFDAAARGLMNLEKTAASASGESKKVEMTGQGGGPVQIDVRALIAQLTAE